MNSKEDVNGLNNGQDENINNKLCQGLSKAELRRNNKPVMEKRRRARINRCLNELKSLILEAMKKDPARHTKLEKADILEMTVKHLQSVQKRQLNVAMHNDPTVIHKFKTGFTECTEEVKRCINQIDGLDNGTRQRLSNYLNNCVNNLDHINTFMGFSNDYTGYTNQIGHYANNKSTLVSAPIITCMQNDANNNGQVHSSITDNKTQFLPSIDGRLHFSAPNKQFQYLDFVNNLRPSSAFSKLNNKANCQSSKYYGTNNPLSQSFISTSPPLSPISSISSYDDESVMHTSSDFASRSTTPAQDEGYSFVTASNSVSGIDDKSDLAHKNFEGKGCDRKAAQNKDFNEYMWRPW